MTPNSKSKMLKRVASTPGEKCNYQVRGDRLFVDEEVEVPELGEKVMKFMLDNDNSFECPDKKKEECDIEGTQLNSFMKNSWSLWWSVP